MRSSLVIGAAGLVGEHLLNLLPSFDSHPIAAFRTTYLPFGERLDIRDLTQVIDLVERIQPQIIFLPAALTNVDLCEIDPVSSYATNVLGVKNVAQAANHVGARLIYFSTDYIFDGVSGPYEEEDAANPISEYGRQKMLAEHYIALTSFDYLILRTTVVYGWERQGKNFVFRLVKSLQEGISVQVPKDQVGTPTYAPELAESAIKLAKMNVNGVIHIAGANCISRYEFALEAAKVFQLSEQLIQPVATVELNQPARRPLLAGLKTERAAGLLGTSYSTSSDGLRCMAMHRN